AHLMYQPVTFVLSLVVCCALAVIALETRPFFDRLLGRRRFVHAAAAVCMGLAVTFMHHTAMAAAMFMPVSGQAPAHPGIAPSLLAILVSLGAIVVVGLTLVATFVDARL